MDEATLTIRFKDESSPGPAGVATTSPQYSGSDPGSVKVADQQNAITQAGGIGAMAEKNSRASTGGTSPASPPPVAPASPAPVASLPMMGGAEKLLPTVREIAQKDATVTAAEIAAALGINQKQAQTLLTAATVQPGGQAGSTTPPVAPSSPPPVAPASPQPVATPPAAPQSTPPVQFARPPELTREQQIAEAERRAPPMQQGEPPPSSSDDARRGVQSTVNTIAQIAAHGGPLGAATGRAVSAAAAVPGVSEGIASAAPVVAAAAPFVLAATAAVGIPVAGAAVLNSIAQTARGQITGLSPEAAQAEAQANVRQLVANMMTARRLGDEIADYVESRSRIGAASQGLRDVIAEPALRDLNNGLRALTHLLEEMNKEPDENAKAAQTGWSALKAGFGALTGLGGLLDMASEWGAKLKDTDAAKLGRDNPLYFYQNLPMPKLPAPFYETDETPLIDRDFGAEMSSMPGLSF